MENVPAIPHTTRINGRYAFRMRVPEKVQPEFDGKKFIKKALGTSNPNEARTKSRVLAVEWDNAFAAAERKLKLQKQAVPSKPQIEAMVISWFHQRNKAIAEGDATLTSGDMSQEADYWHDHGADQAIWNNPEEETRRMEWANTDAKKILKANHAQLPADHPHYQFLLILVVRANKELLQQREDRLFKQRFDGRCYDALFKKEAIVIANSSIQQISLSDAVEEYLKDTGLAVTPETMKGYTAKLRVLCELLGNDKPVAIITRKMMREVRDKLMTYPSNAKKHYPHSTVDEAIEKAKKDGKPPLKKKTLNHYLNCYATFFQFARKNDYCENNPAEELTLKTSHNEQKESKYPFDIQQLNLIFGGYHTWKWGMKKEAPPADCLWVPLISLYTGMRLAECCQLWITDIQQENGIYYFCVTPAEDTEGEEAAKKVKTKAAKRMVPIHSRLIALGFLEYVKHRRTTGSKRLFPNIPTRSKFKRIGGWFNRKMDAIEYTDKPVSFHSLRHTVKDEMMNRGVDVVMRHALGGWKNDAEGTSSIYGSGYNMQIKQEAIEKIRYEGLDLSSVEPLLRGGSI